MGTLLQEYGFEIVSQFLGTETISAVTESIEDSHAQRSRAGIRSAFRISAVRSLATDEELLARAREALGKNASPFRATLFDKSSKSNWLVVWHQDTALPLRQRREVAGWGPWSVKEGVICAHAPAPALEQILAIRVHLDDSDGENGALRVLPGSHTLGVLTDDTIHDLVEHIPVVECCIPVGGTLFMKPLLVHASSKARSSRSRRVLHIEYSSRGFFEGGLELALGQQQLSCARAKPDDPISAK